MPTTAATMKTEKKMKIILVCGTVHRTGLEERNPTDSCTSLPFLVQDHHGKGKVDQGIKAKSKLFQQLKKNGEGDAL